MQGLHNKVHHESAYRCNHKECFAVCERPQPHWIHSSKRSLRWKRSYIFSSSTCSRRDPSSCCRCSCRSFCSSSRPNACKNSSEGSLSQKEEENDADTCKSSEFSYTGDTLEWTTYLKNGIAQEFLLNDWVPGQNRVLFSQQHLIWIIWLEAHRSSMMGQSFVFHTLYSPKYKLFMQNSLMLFIYSFVSCFPKSNTIHALNCGKLWSSWIRILAQYIF